MWGGIPNIEMQPASGRSTPQSRRMSVVLPAQSGPITPNISPAATRRSSGPSRKMSLNDFVSCSVRTVSIVSSRVFSYSDSQIKLEYVYCPPQPKKEEEPLKLQTDSKSK